MKKSVRGFVFRISKSIVRAEGFKLACQVLPRLIIYGGWKQFPVLFKTQSLMGHYNHSIPVDAKIMISRNCPIIGEQVAVNFVAQ